MNLKKLTNRGLDLLYPPSLYCSCCGNLIDESRTYNLCDHCMSHIRWEGGEPEERDGMKAIFCTRYGIYERSLIFALKYNGKKYIARDIAEIMSDRLSLENAVIDAVVPVPLHPEKEKRRGFNHAALIGRHLGRKVGAPCIEHGLLRTEDTMPMRGLSPVERELNVKGKFIVNEKWTEQMKEKKILLIDDFYTTGSTARECFRAIEAARPKEVWFMAFAVR